MKKKERILKNIAENKELQKGMSRLGIYSDERFYEDAIRYIKAIKEGRVICNIDTVSSSGMSRTISFLECTRSRYSKGIRYMYLNFFAFFKALGYQEVPNKHTFRIHGCGMDMIFYTNYTNIHGLHRLGFITRKQCDYLAQQTPTVI